MTPHPCPANHKLRTPFRALFCLGGFIFFLTCLSLALGAPTILSGKKVVIPVYGHDLSTPLMVLKMDEVKKESRRFGYYRVKTAPIALIQNLECEILGPVEKGLWEKGIASVMKALQQTRFKVNSLTIKAPAFQTELKGSSLTASRKTGVLEFELKNLSVTRNGQSENFSSLKFAVQTQQPNTILWKNKEKHRLLEAFFRAY